jgi:hypothetical protein
MSGRTLPSRFATASRDSARLHGDAYIADDECDELRAGPDLQARAPEEYISRFMELGVSSVVRLNEPETCDRVVFEAAAMQHLDMWFADFFAPADAAEGVVALHCLAGLGRNGTLIAPWPMRQFGWIALATIGWLRIARPGSVIGAQQHFLCQAEPLLRSSAHIMPVGANHPEVTLRCRRTPPRALSQ